MKAHLEVQGEEIWDAVENGPFVPISVINDVGTIKIKIAWDDDDKKIFSTTKRKLIYFRALLAYG